MKKLTLLALYCCLFFISSAQVNNDSLLATLQLLPLETEKDLNLIVREIVKKERDLSNQANIKLWEWLLKEVEQKPSFNNVYGHELAHSIANILGSYYELLNDNVNLEKCLEKSLVHAKAAGNHRYTIEAYAGFGYYFQAKENLLEANKYHLKIIEESDTTIIPHQIIIASYVNISNGLIRMGEQEKSLGYLRRALKEIKLINMEEQLYYSTYFYKSLFDYFDKQQQHDSIKLYWHKFIYANAQLKEVVSDGQSPIEYDMTISENYIQIASRYLKDGKINQAKLYYDTVQTLSRFNVVEKYLLDVDYLIATNQLLKTQQLLNKLPNELDTLNNVAYLNSVANYYRKKGNVEQSWYYLTKKQEKELDNLEVQESLFSSYTAEKINAIEKEKEIATLQQRQNFQRGLGGLLLLMVLLLIYAFYQSKTKNKYLKENLAQQKIVEQQSRELRQAEQQKNKLFNNIAHEFQTPLNIIQGLSSNLVSTENLSPKAQASLNIITKNGQLLSKTTNQILTINRSKGKVTTPNLVRFNLTDLLNYLLPEFQLLADNKAIQIEYAPLENQPILIFSEVEKITTILKNLLANAIKYSENQGQIKIVYEKNGDHLISVSNTGKGILPEDLPHLFDRYYQAPQLEPEGGFGLGLAICKEYIESLEGTIQVKSDESWTTFTIQFPVHSSELANSSRELYQFPFITAAPKLNNYSSISSSENQDKLLIVEDNLDFCKFLETILLGEYHLRFVHNGQAALTALETYEPDLILTDWMMPGMDGLSFVQQLKSSEKWQHYPILMLTARNLETDKVRALRIGIDDYLVKPIETNVLKNRIAHLLDAQIEKKVSYESAKMRTFDHADLELSNADQNWLMKVEQMIYPFLEDFDLTLTDIIAQLDISETHFNRKLKKLTGLTAKRYIQELRYWEARRLLETGEVDSVKAASYSVGFKDAKYFARKFKYRFGQYPSEFLNVQV